VLVNVWRDGNLHSTVATLRTTNDHNVTPLARKAWLGISTQPLSTKIRKHLNIDAEGGARITRIFPGAPADKAGLKVGDVLLSVDGEPVPEKRLEDTDELDRMIRQYKSDSKATLSVWREGKIQDMVVSLEAQPIPPDELPWWEDLQLEFSARDIAFDDVIHLQIDPKTTGAFLQTVTLAGWAYLGGLRANDIVISADGTAIKNVEDLKNARAEAVKSGRTWWVLQVYRNTENTFVEINLKPTHS
jgi:serine protease Do